MVPDPMFRQNLDKAAPDLSVLSDFFDSDWYLENHPNARNLDEGPLEHYLKFGIQERFSPHPLFDASWYFEKIGLKNDGRVEPLTHYFDIGWRRLYSPHPLFDPAWYLLQNPDVMAANIDPLRHYLSQGWVEGRTLHPLFDSKWYLKNYKDVADAKMEPLTHFLKFGWKENRRPHPLFDTAWYLETNEDVARSGVNPWLHYITSGWRNGRSPHPKFDGKWYQKQYLDEITARHEPLHHYLSKGWREGLLPSPNAKSMPLGAAAPLYLEVVEEIYRAKNPTPKYTSSFRSRGTLLLVVHETEVGGAPHVVRQFAQWMRDRTRFDIRLVSLRGGNLRHAFADVAPLIVLSDYPEEERALALKDFMGSEVRGAFINSIASGGILKYLPSSIPTVAFIHELPKILEQFTAELDVVRALSSCVIGGGPEVVTALRDIYHFDAKKLVSAHSFVESLGPDTDFEQRRLSARASLGLARGRLVVMGCGVLHWRKSPDKFIETAEKIINQGIDADFIWLGGGPDHEMCEAMIASKGLEGRVRITGYEPDVAGKLAAGDVFLLSSQEDPFPLVALYAAQSGMPIVCFQNAGGIEGFVARGGGLAVPFMDVAAMADAVSGYLLDEDRRVTDGQLGRQQVERHHTIDVVGPFLLDHLRAAMGLKPEVSVVVPNFNYEKYLPERLSSIAQQTFQDFEVILLDDASTDGSVALLNDFAERRAATRIVVNSTNSGSPFVQWMRGMEMAQSELIWLAEADDRCHPEFLQTMLPMFDDRNVRIASCASQPITSDGKIIGDYRTLYLDRITKGRWDQDYVATDHEEANAGLGIANSIPNASAVMFRKFQPESDFVKELMEMRLCGDWYFYVRAMRGGMFGFSSRLMNDHRRHGETVTHRLEGSMRYFGELATVRSYLGRTYRQSPQAQTRIAEFLSQDIARFNVSEPGMLPSVPVANKDIPSLLVVAPDLSPGGGQVFAISVANEWSRRGGRVVLLNINNQPSHPAMVTKIDPQVTLLDATQPHTDLGTLIKRFDLDVVHSSIWWADRWVDMNRSALPDTMPWIITMHGCHETILAEPGIDGSFPERIPRMIQRAKWAYIAEKNLKIFEVYGMPKQISKVPNGVKDVTVAQKFLRSDIGLREEAIVLCIASRAIVEKGWHAAVELTRRLNENGHPVDLLLLGEGPAEKEIRQQNPKHVHLLGQVTDPSAYFCLADVGVLPSTFVGESLPLVLLEMMAQGLPLIASAVGEIPAVIGHGEDAAGLLVPLLGKNLDETALYEAALHLIVNPSKRATMGQAARKRFEKNYNLASMLDRYSDLYTVTGNPLNSMESA